VCGQHHAPAAFIPGKDPLPIVHEIGWAPEPVLVGAENLAPPGFDPRTLQPVGSRYTDYAIPTPRLIVPARINRTHKTSKYLIKIYLFVYIKLWSTSRYAVFDVILCRLSMSFSNYNSDVTRRGSAECHIQLAMGKRQAIYCVTFKRLPWTLLIFIANAILTGNCLLHCLKGMVGSDGHHWILGTRKGFLELVTSGAMQSEITTCMQCFRKIFMIMCCDYRRPREANVIHFPWPPMEAAVSIFYVIIFCYKQFL
jgi:hypothetical protein